MTDPVQGPRSRRARAIMLQGTGSDVGKSTLVAALCRAAVRRGLVVRPFKPQNMSNNAAVTLDGGEIGRAQALQARAARVAPSVHMNPVLLKPESNVGSQVVLRGRALGSTRAAEYQELKATLRGAVLESFELLAAEADLVVVEGAGSPAEINLRKGDIANMGFAVPARVPVVIVGDIDRGGVIASLVGTHALLADDERALVAGFLVNKFRGDLRLFDNGVTAITERTGWASFGVVPWLPAVARLPSEDSLSLARQRPTLGAKLRVAVPMLSRIANFDDVDPLALEAGIDVHMIPPGTAIPAVDVIVLPGTKATRADLDFLRAQGWDVDIAAHARRGGRVVGLCGGYQMLGRAVHDPAGVEGAPGSTAGLALLDVETTLAADKTVRQARGTHRASGAAVEGYEIHVGVTDGPARNRPLLDLDGKPEGAVDPSGRVLGTYLHGLFGSDGFRRAWLGSLGVEASGESYEASVEQALDALADHFEAHASVDALLAAAR